MSIQKLKEKTINTINELKVGPLASAESSLSNKYLIVMGIIETGMHTVLNTCDGSIDDEVSHAYMMVLLHNELIRIRQYIQENYTYEYVTMTDFISHQLFMHAMDN